MEKFVTPIKYVPVDHDPFDARTIQLTLPTTEAQREIFAAAHMGSDASCAYNESVSLELSGRLDRKAMIESIHVLVARHEGLRSTIDPNGMRVIVSEVLGPIIETHDLSGFPENEQQDRLSAISDGLMTRPFDLLNGPLFRTDLIRMAEDRHLLRLTAHHIICDGWSLGIILSDISKIYNAKVDGSQPALSAAVPFSRYVQETIAFSKTTEYKRTLEHWLKIYQGHVPRLDLPTDRARPAQKTFPAERMDIELSEERVKRLKEISTRLGSSLVTTLLTTFEVLLHEITGQEDLVVGLPAAGQSDMGMRDLVGHCVNLLPLRSHVDPADKFSDHLKARRTQVLDAFDHQRTTFGSLVKALKVPREPGRIPLAPVVFNIDMNMDDGVQFNGLSHRFISEPRAYENFELFLNATGNDRSLVLEWAYNTDLFDPSTIRGWIARLEAIIDAVSADPGITIKELITSKQRSRTATIPSSWNGDPKPLPFATINEAFQAVCERSPDRIAVVLKDQHITYMDLRKMVDAYCHLLDRSGVVQGDRVGICAERSFNMVAAMLATLRMGAAFVPLDPSYPMDRLSLMLEDTSVKVLFTQASLRYKIPDHRSKVLMLDDPLTPVDAPPLTPAADPHTAAYIMYTSGSTGVPKGVVVPHRAVLRLVNEQNFLTFSEDLVFLQLSNTSFDASTLEIWGALLTGAKLILQPQVKPTVDEIVSNINEHQVTTVWFTSGLFNILVDERSSALKGLKHILTGGDVLSVKHVRKALEVLGPNVLINGYGPTENTTFTCCYAINDANSIEQGVPIGRPIANTQVYILDDNGHEVGIGEPGELYAAGEGVALGYWNRPDLTEERFLPSLNKQQGGLMYRTGDLVKWLPDGNIAFLGRADGQVKVRGFRIELGEISAAMDDLPLIKDKVVICRTDHPGEKELVAYLVPAAIEDLDPEHQAPLIAKARAHLRERLPQHMLPNAYMLMDALPLTANGKIDRSALPIPQVKTSVMKAKYVAPRDHLERILASIWQHLLDIDKIGVHDDFFELGGHSLIGIQLFAQVERQLNKKLPLKILFQAPTIAQLAKHIQQEKVVVPWKNLSPIQPDGPDLPFFSVHADEANHFLPKYLGTDQPFYAFFHQGEEGHRIQFTTVEDIAKHFIAEMRSVRAHGPYLLGGYSFGGIVAFEMALQLRKAGEQVPLLALFDTYGPEAYVEVMKNESRFYDPIKKMIMRRIAKYYLDRGTPLPGKLRHFYIIDTYDKAIRDYLPGYFDGTIQVIKATGSIGADDMGWKDLAEQVEVSTIAGDHYSIVREPHVQGLAKVLGAKIATVNKDVRVDAV